MRSRKNLNSHIAFDDVQSNNLVIAGIDLLPSEASERKPRLFLDLSGNLRVKDRGSDAYLDAKKLVDGGIHDLKLIQVFDRPVTENLARALRIRGFSEGRVGCSILLEVLHEKFATLSFSSEHAFQLSFEKTA